AGQRKLNEHLTQARGQPLKNEPKAAAVGPATNTNPPPGRGAARTIPTGTPGNTVTTRPRHTYPDLNSDGPTPPPARTNRRIPPRVIAELRERLYGDQVPRPGFGVRRIDTDPLAPTSWTQPLSEIPGGSR